ncbi:TIGR02444 family protein [Pseudomonas sp. HR96]|uniref:TIGR02444 family protein n=1 Tax=Pseudomonas sp. HR96 TaxID=1027966 RepID=UPI002A764C71|nr:TIGR02444 family protein [Pseudomonas sp. HR96]WPO99780.1 TIGR02444 family protein [Pseudomonas sp. HR96]
MHADLWSFALDLYARPGVEAASLELQQAGADVCVLISAAWLGQRGVPWRREYLGRLQLLADPWQTDVVSPLRHLRQQWRAAAQTNDELAALREQVKALELEAERQLLVRLQGLAIGWPPEAARDLELWLEQAVPAEARSNRGALQALHAAIVAG